MDEPNLEFGVDPTTDLFYIKNMSYAEAKRLHYFIHMKLKGLDEPAYEYVNKTMQRLRDDMKRQLNL